MKKGAANVANIITLFIGLALMGFGLYKFVPAQSEISNTRFYTFKAPYTKYERGVLIDKWTGIICMIVAVVIFIILLIAVIYTNKHTQNINGMNYQNGIVNCPNCGLSVSTNLITCPRCGVSLATNSMPYSYGYAATMSAGNMQTPQQFNEQPVSQQKNAMIYCTSCGNPLNGGEAYCSKCGNKVNS
ncbi:MAG: zinc ribbon domain-containing protein [bacterium]|nr:zinc ribbon domain-containing protein [bacterium]